MDINDLTIRRYPVEYEELINIKVDVYRNLHKNMWSVRALEGDYKGKVILNTPELVLSDSEFVVSQKGRDWVIENKVKKVHAVVRGKLKSLCLNEYEDMIEDKKEIYYNPYKTKYFTLRCNGEVLNGDCYKVIFTKECKVYIY